jgi:hypothetical protein
MRRLILRFHACYLGLSALAGLIFLDMAAVLYGIGPEARLLGAAPGTAIGFIEAHGLALILSVLFWRAPASRAWHITGAATAGLLGVCNLAFWDMFVATESLAMGYVATGLHLAVAALQIGAALTVSRTAITSTAAPRVRAEVAR